MSDRFPMATPARLADPEYLAELKARSEVMMAKADGYSPELRALVREYNLIGVHLAIAEVGEDPEQVAAVLARWRRQHQFQALRIVRDVGASFARQRR